MIQTARLTLRCPTVDDFPIYREFYSDAEASSFYGGPIDTAAAWRRLAFDIGHWALRGHGMWSVVERASDRMIGGCGLLWPEGYPRSELTWWILPAARRQGFASEASAAVIAFGYEVLGWSTIETHMKDENVAAHLLAARLGSRIIAREVFPDGIARDVHAFPKPGSPR
ncbi:GNAT family N-acetyltransferase [Sphingomonas sp. GB1N7]